MIHPKFQRSRKWWRYRCITWSKREGPTGVLVARWRRSGRRARGGGGSGSGRGGGGGKRVVWRLARGKGMIRNRPLASLRGCGGLPHLPRRRQTARTCSAYEEVNRCAFRRRRRIPQFSWAFLGLVSAYGPSGPHRPTAFAMFLYLFQETTAYFREKNTTSYKKIRKV
jgi:hypothetical protein